MIEKLDPYRSAPSFEADAWQPLALSRLRLVDLNDPSAARPLLKRDIPGVTAGPFSPDGKFMVVHRFAERRRQAGIATLDSGEVRWLDLSPELALYGRSVQWISDTEFVVIVMQNGEHPLCSTVLPGGERCQIVIPPATPEGCVSLNRLRLSRNADERALGAAAIEFLEALPPPFTRHQNYVARLRLETQSRYLTPEQSKASDLSKSATVRRDTERERSR